MSDLTKLMDKLNIEEADAKADVLIRYMDPLPGTGGELHALLHGRAEDLARTEDYREAFDLCVSRAVANMRVLSEYCIPFVRVGGSFIAYKGADCESEIGDSKEAIRRLGGGETEIRKLPHLGHSLVIIKKVSPTPKTYPRRAGTPARKPL